MSKMILILGGTRSGKSGYAVKLAKEIGGNVAFIATAEALDKEMEKRIRLHKASRPKRWKLIEERKDVAAILSKLKNRYDVILIDCLGLLISNLLAEDLKDKEIERRMGKLIRAISKTGMTTLLVSNEVGMGVVPSNHLARRFTDLIGLANQMAAEKADEVIFMQAGVPLRLKEV